MKVVCGEPANFIRLEVDHIQFYVKLSKDEKIGEKGIDKLFFPFYNDGVDSKGAVGIFLRRLFYLFRLFMRNAGRHC